MPTKTPKPFVHCVGNPDFEPEKAVGDHDRHQAALKLLEERNDFEGAVRLWFGMPEAGKDDYVYHALASVTLGQVQRGVEMGAEKGLHGWYEGAKDGEVYCVYPSHPFPAPSPPRLANTPSRHPFLPRQQRI